MASTNKAIAVQRWLLVGVLASAAFLGTRHVVFGNVSGLGIYSCCGESDCSTLRAVCACPNNEDRDCRYCGSYTTCCVDRCNH